MKSNPDTLALEFGPCSHVSKMGIKSPTLTTFSRTCDLPLPVAQVSGFTIVADLPLGIGIGAETPSLWRG